MSNQVTAQREEYLVNFYVSQFGVQPDAPVFSAAPGRVELAGNHTDHQGGRVVSAAIGNSVWALATLQDKPCIDLAMEGYGTASIALGDPSWTEPQPLERHTSEALVRGVAAQLAKAGVAIEGCRIVTMSDVPVGAGLSSSAAFEMAIAAVLAELFASFCHTEEDLLEMALVGVAAERDYFGKPCGAQDQITSALGGIVAMDFANFPPEARHIPFDFSACEYRICLVDSRCDHSAFNEDFAQIIDDMGSVSAFFGKQRLGDISPDLFYGQLAQLRAQVGDRAVLRAIHFIEETKRVGNQIAALEANDIDAFIACVDKSGASSAQFLQNMVHPTLDNREQPAVLVAALCARQLEGCGAYKINGGGFGGGVVAFVPGEQSAAFEASINASLGYEACTWLEVGAPGARAWRNAN